MTSRTCIAVFARAPRLGEVKTRIAVDAGAAAALHVYRQMLRHSLRQAHHTGHRVVLCATDIACTELNALAHEFDCELLAQSQGDLGARMAHAFRLLHQRFEQVIIIGSDCPAMTSVHLNAATSALSATAMVLTPAEDGGYVLIASAQPKLWLSEVFCNVHWSSPSTLNDTLSNLHGLGVQVTMLDALWDVDTLEDAKRAAALGLLELLDLAQR